MKVSKFMVPLEKIKYLYDTDTIDTASKLIISAKIGSVLIVKKKQGQKYPSAIGFLTKTDLIAWYSNDGSCGKEQIGKYIKKKLFLCKEDSDRAKVAEEMVKNHLHHLLVVNKDNEIIGLVSSMDFAREFYLDSQDTVRKLFGITKTDVEMSFKDFLASLTEILPDQDVETKIVGME